MITTDEIKIEDNRLFINDVVFPNYSVIRYLGGGKNGIVYLVKNDILLREEALKIWIKNDEDKRDKIQQGLLESQKLSKINGKHSIQIYNASVFENHIIANMEYFEGQTLKDFIKDKTPYLICFVLRQYLIAINETSNLDIYHGDPHSKNVLVRLEEDKYGTNLILKFCDFGTSFFSGRNFSFKRHWNIVYKTIKECTKHLKGYDEACAFLETNDLAKKQINSGIKYLRDKIFNNGVYITAPLKDYLEIILYANTGKMSLNQF